MIEYIKNPKAYELKNRQISSEWGPRNITEFWCTWVKDLGHTGI